MTYKYLCTSSKFSAGQKDFYEENGFILMKNNVSHELLDKCRKRFLEIANKGYELAGSTRVIKDPVLGKTNASGEYKINKLQDFLYDDIFSQYCMCDSVVDVVENIIGPNITGVHSMLINKPPNSHPDISKHPLHQDLHYFPFRPPNKIVASWTAMENTFAENGCLYVVPGSHKWGKLYDHGYPEDNQNSLYYGIQGKDHLPKVDLIMEKGDTVFFHPLLFHGSYPNRTKHFRKAISCHYASSSCHFIDVKNTNQKHVAEEVETIIEKKSKLKITYQELWRLKSRLIRGPPGNFQQVNSHL